MAAAVASAVVVLTRAGSTIWRVATETERGVTRRRRGRRRAKVGAEATGRLRVAVAKPRWLL